MNAVRNRSPRGRKPAAKPFSLVETLASVRFAVLIVALIAVACAAGTLVPQGSEAARYLEAHPEAAQRFAVFEAVGLTAVYTSWWFIGLLFVLSASVLACSSKRFSALLRTSGFARRRCLGSLLTHMSILLILAGGIVRGVWGEKGYVELREGRPVVGRKMLGADHRDRAAELLAPQRRAEPGHGQAAAHDHEPPGLRVQARARPGRHVGAH